MREWTVDLGSCTASHKDGWVFKFTADPDGSGAIDGELVDMPESMPAGADFDAPRLAREAGDAYLQALRKRN